MVLCVCSNSNVLNQPDCILNRAYRWQLLATVTVLILAFSHGVGLGWLSPTLIKLQSENSPLSFPVGLAEASWIGSAMAIGAVFGCLMLGALLDYLGRKPCLYLLAIPHIGLWVLIYCAQSVEYLYVARFLGGMTSNLYYVNPIFIGEIADSKIRGKLSAMIMFSASSGTLLGYTASTYLDYYLTPLLVLTLPVAYLLCMCYFPETPQHLLRQERYSDAEKSYRFYRNCTSRQESEAPTRFKEDFEELHAIIKKSNEGTNLSFRDFLTKPALKALLTGSILIFTNQVSCLFVFVNYMSDIFQESSSNIDPNVCTIVMGAMQILGCYASVLFVDRFGRKSIFLLSVTSVIIGQTTFGLYTYFVGKQGFWIPLLLMAFIICVGIMGLVNLVFVIIVEIFPAKIRSVSVSYALTLYSVLLFFTLKIFPIYMHTYGVAVTMWTCAAACVFGAVYLAIFLPETKGKSMDS